MSDTDTVSAPDGGLTAQETAYFETGGQAQVEPVVEGAEPPKEPPADDPADKVEKVVPLAAVHEERSKRKALQEKLRAAELENAEYKGRFKIIERLQEEPKAEPVARPKVEEDPFAALGHHDKTIDEVMKRLDAFENTSKQRTEQQGLENAYKNAATQFLGEKPDFLDAYHHLRASRAKELELLGYDANSAYQAIHNEELSIAQSAFRSGKNPAEIIYALASQRGYVFKDPKADSAAKLDTIEKGQAANKSLTNTSGGTGEVEMTADRLIKMPIEDFTTWCEKYPAKARRLMGG